jgi:lysophospholipase L1-like esterase
VPIDEYRANLSSIVQELRGLTERVLVITPAPCNEDGWMRHRAAQGRETDRSLASTQSYHNAALEVAAEINAHVLDSWSFLTAEQDYFVDGVHFSSKGNDALFGGF